MVSQSERNRQQYLTHHERILAHARKYREANRERINAKAKARYDHPIAKAKRKVYLEKNKERIKAYRQQYNKSHYYNVGKNKRKWLRELQWKYKATHPCVDCGECDPIVLDFDHIRGEKRFNLSKGHTYSSGAMLKEMEKCEIRCANCHRRRTAKTQWRNEGGGAK